MQQKKRWYVRLAAWSPLIAFFTFFITGIIFWGGLNWTMELTNTEAFCISCHEMEVNVYQEYRKTIHYGNRTGVRATCPDCHVPREWTHKIIRKIKATNELYHWLLGSIDSKEKFQAKRHELAKHVWQSMRETESRECRNCHANQSMVTEKQMPMAKITHELGIAWGYSCIECHQGIAHELPAEFDKEALLDQIHRRIEKEGVACHQCHDDLYTPAANDEW